VRLRQQKLGPEEAYSSRRICDVAAELDSSIFGGNGRTARAFSYLVLCIGLQFAPPANQKTIPQFIEEKPDPYTNALRAADKAWAEGKLDLSAMEKLLGDLLAMQLVFLHESATGLHHLQ
jgi:hypothetical protein